MVGLENHGSQSSVCRLYYWQFKLVFHDESRHEKCQNPLSAQAKEASIHRELTQRKYGSWYLAAINFSMTILFVVLHYTTVILQDQTAPYFFPLFLVFNVVTLGGLLVFIWKLSKSNERFDEVHTNETAVTDDQYWKWGVFIAIIMIHPY